MNMIKAEQMSKNQPDRHAWERYIKAVFPYSDAITKDDLSFFEECGRLVLSIHSHKFFVEFVKQIKDSMVFIPPKEHYPLLYLTEQISLKRAEGMRKSNTPFIDVKGNAFINLPDFYLFVMGRRQGKSSPVWPHSRPAGKLFRKSGIKLIYLFLSDPRLDQDWGNDLLNVSVRELASESEMSTGSVSELLTEMKERGFLLTDGRFKRLINRKVLFDQWMRGYMDYRFKVKKQCFKADRVAWWEDRKPERDGFLWGGEPAGAVLTDGFMRPQKLTIYTDKPLYDLVVDENLHQVSVDGNVEFIEPFLKTKGEQGCVHPLLVYADLVCSSDDRNTETATRIYDRYLRQVIEPA